LAKTGGKITMLKYNKPHPDDEGKFHSTKFYVCVCATHCVPLVENEPYSFRMPCGVFYVFDEDEVDLSGLECPSHADCSNDWIAVEVPQTQDEQEAE
jgi:hypothetical protein